MLTLLFFICLRPMHINVQARRLEEFFLLMAVCNTVVVAKKPHRDRMNDVGQMEMSATDCSVHVSQIADDGEGSITTVASEREPSPSIESGSCSISSTTLIVPPSSTSLPLTSALDQSNNSTPKRPSNLSFFSGKRLFLPVSESLLILLYY